MNKSIFADILKSIKPEPSTYKKGYTDYAETCNKIYQIASSADHPFTFMNGSVHVYAGTHWEAVDDLTLKVFLKYAFFGLSGDPVLSSGRSLVDNLLKQFPYTVLNLNTEPPAKKINFRNGTLNLDNYKLEKHNPDDYFTYSLEYDYDKKAKCPVFDKYLSEVLPEKEAQQVIAEYIAWIFTPDLKLEKILFLYGSGCNGKSVLVEIIEALVGRENVANESLSDIADNPNSRANLVGKLLNTCSDIGTSIAKPDVIKRTASGEAISYKVLYKDVVTTTRYAKSIFCLNELPKTTDHSEGFFRRFLIVPFLTHIPKSKIDPKLPEKIISKELPGIMNWVIEGHKRLMKSKTFTESKMVSKICEEYKNSTGSNNHVKLLLPPLYK